MTSSNNKNFKPSSLLLYGVTDNHWVGKYSLLDQVEQSIKGGVTFVQYREKHFDMSTMRGEILSIQDICKRYGVPFIVNDYADIAAEINADGVHVGSSDCDVAAARKLLGESKIIGASVGTVERAIMAEKNGADYLGVGTMFPTSSKDDAKPVTIETLRDICAAVSIPVCAIGGITYENMHELDGTGISGVAMISSIYGAPDIESATRRLRYKLDKMNMRK